MKKEDKLDRQIRTGAEASDGLTSDLCSSSSVETSSSRSSSSPLLLLDSCFLLLLFCSFSLCLRFSFFFWGVNHSVKPPQKQQRGESLETFLTFSFLCLCCFFFFSFFLSFVSGGGRQPEEVLLPVEDIRRTV